MQSFPPCCGCSPFCLLSLTSFNRTPYKDFLNLQKLNPFLSYALSPCLFTAPEYPEGYRPGSCALCFHPLAQDSTSLTLGRHSTNSDWWMGGQRGREVGEETHKAQHTVRHINMCWQTYVSVWCHVTMPSRDRTHSSIKLGFLIHFSLCRKSFKVGQVQVNIWNIKHSVLILCFTDCLVGTHRINRKHHFGSLKDNGSMLH